MLCRTLHDFCEIACSSCRASFPAPMIVRSMTNLGIVFTLGSALGHAGCRPCRETAAGEPICIEADAPTQRSGGGAHQGQMSRVGAFSGKVGTGFPSENATSARS